MENQDKNISEHMNKWEFDEEVSQVFDEMLNRSIPSYNRMRYLINEISKQHIKNSSLKHNNILDIGCSTGEQIYSLCDYLPLNKFIGVECSQPMVKEARKKLQNKNNTEILTLDVVKDELPVLQCAIIFSILTLQFIPIEYRQQILKKIYDSLDENGIFIFVEKIIGDNFNYSELYEKIYYNMKEMNGYSIKEIRDKKMKLEGVLVPVTNSFNIELLKQAGFTKIDIFWKDLNFIGYVVMK